MSKKSERNVMTNEELAMWLNQKGVSNPNAVSNVHHGHVPSITSQSSPSSRFSQNDMINDDKWMFGDDVDVDMLLSNDFSRMSIFDEQAKTRVYGVMDSPSSYTYSHSHTPCLLDAHAYVHEKTGIPFPLPTCCDSVFADVKELKRVLGTPMESSLNHKRSTCYEQVQLQKPFYDSSNSRDRFVCSTRRPFAMECDSGWDFKSPFMFSEPKLARNANTVPSSYNYNFPVMKERGTMLTEDPVAFRCDSSFIVQEKDMKCCCVDGMCRCNSFGGFRRNSRREVPQSVPFRHDYASHGRNSVSASGVSLLQSLLPSFGSLVEVQGYMNHLATDHNGCRFLQRVVDEGTSEDRLIVFNGVIDNVVELMMDPFGNYLVQKLLDVCRDDERFQILLMLTKEPGQLVRISLNSYGTRVVQKLIGTINSRNQISLVKSAIQPGFLELIEDLNGNHVIQRCLQCFSCQDNEFIFDAAAKFCVDIATHQHGCCVLQRCIDYSKGKYQDKLVKEICRHGLFLAQDPFGNYVVQYIIEMENPSASAKLLSQFRGNYVNLSMQKFSSHVVEKCLKHVVDSRPRIVHELLSVPHFEQLLQDPYANYVVQRALGVTKGSLHASLVEAVRPHKILRTSPYCKRIFSRNLLKK